MGWFSRRNETGGWQEATTPLVLDLDALRLSGTACGDHADGLAFLGPGRPGVRSCVYVYPDRGLAIELARGRVQALTVYLRPTDDTRAFTGIVRHRGEVIHPAALVGEAAVVARFGEPDEIESVEIDGWDARQVFTYLTDAVEWELLLTADGRLMEVNLYARD